MAPRKQDAGEGQGSKRAATKDSEDYKKRRERNNIAVRKSRQLSRQKAKVTEDKVKQLRAENKGLEDKVKLLSKELGVLKDLFMSAAVPSSSGGLDTLTVQEEAVLNELKTVEADHKYSTS